MNTSKQLLDEIGERISKDKNKKIGFSLLYACNTTNKADVGEFHAKCDAKGPTVTILYGKFNTLFGGYTSQSWSSTNRQKVKDENAFLFKKDDRLDAKCVFLPIRRGQTDKAIVCDKNFGPTFGVGMFNRYDLQTFKKDSKQESKKKGDFLKLNGSLNVRFSYSVERQNTDDEDGNGVSQLKEINSGQMLVRTLEVYQVIAVQTDEDIK
ncbi:uncharacterized protein LOC132741356 [Ruditapes philippinarum]|uniref:uncharacterized protein LOC132741356 n=1 Tax=Ruditapes philippinarum TaxID=129788 RepID=UPI00295AC85E|nr:uncharacterized protein LOC132741356 [Ruditapes philippinarum]